LTINWTACWDWPSRIYPLVDHFRHENEVFPQASSIKIAVLLEVFKQAEEGQLKLDEFINLTPESR
jgi:hypothetical protein